MAVPPADNRGDDLPDRGERAGVAPSPRVAPSVKLPPELRCQEGPVEWVEAPARVHVTQTPPVPSGRDGRFLRQRRMLLGI